ncbi:GNAT family N-acetyltransferase [Clostridium estertheticum]|uniref:GNAT family N-acetyltransferase n=1 Tax=Clostridium estertheticum TaxID=238834 RepID=A0AA47EIV4_9CLOT|nr:GNAT family N-acetyltransferase [Clostridium estertheticum]WAG61004.1 GNAT family N-acetyltransferase [Clostridium estertheticum]WAG64839.1 GNAT family N-acetyltransferase [Clostridium estertheticum]
MDILITDRLIIRPIAEQDCYDISEYGCDEDTGKYMIYWPKSKNNIRKFIDECTTCMNSNTVTWYEFAIQLKENNKVVGNISLETKEEFSEIGWISNKVYWNNGYMTEAVREIIKYAFHKLNITKIMSTCTNKNRASYRVMEKCGMTKIKEEKNYKSIKQGIEVEYDKLTYCIEG